MGVIEELKSVLYFGGMAVCIVMAIVIAVGTVWFLTKNDDKEV